METLLNYLLLAPVANLLVVAGLVFCGIAVIGGIAGKFDPGRRGRIGAGIIGGLFVLLGLILVASGNGLSAAAKAANGSPLDAPLANVLIVAGIVFLAIAVIGGISGKFEPGKEGRVAAGTVGGALVLIGFVMVVRGIGNADTRSPASPLSQPPTVVAAAPLPTATANPTQTPSPTATPNPTATARPATPLPAITAGAPVVSVPLRDIHALVQSNDELDMTETWQVQFGSPAQSRFVLAFVGGPSQDLVGFHVSEDGLAYAENASHAVSSLDVVRTVGADGLKNIGVSWYFSPTANMTRTFLLRYTMRGFVAVGGDGTHWVTFIAAGRGGYSYRTMHYLFTLPKSYDPASLFAQAQLNSVDSPGGRVVDGQTIEFTEQNVGTDKAFRLQFSYPQP